MVRRVLVLLVTLLVGLGVAAASAAPGYALAQHVDNPAQAPMEP